MAIDSGSSPDAQGTLTVAVPACSHGALALVFAPGVLRGWVDEAERAHAAAVVVRDADGRRLFGDASVDPAQIPVLKDRPTERHGVSTAEAVHLHDWGADPYARGAYSYVGVGGTGAAKYLARPLARTLHFAGEALAPGGENGTGEGAIGSGESAAARLLRARRAAG